MKSPDQSIAPEELLQHASFLRAVARGVVGNEASVEDVVQDTWVLALERPPARRASFRGWLTHVARHVALNTRRGESRRIVRERESARLEAVEPAEQVLEQIEASRSLSLVVHDLQEPYRTAIFLRYYEGLLPTAIAERLGVPLKTVKTRLARALTQLRHRLDADHDGSRESWLKALMPVALGSIASKSGTGAVSGGGLISARILRHAVLMNMKKISIAIAVGLLSVVVWQFPGLSPADTNQLRVSAAPLIQPLIEVSSEDVPDAPGELAPSHVDEAAEVDGNRQPDVAAPVVPEYGMHVLVLTEGDVPVPGAMVERAVFRDGIDARSTGRRTTDEVGRARFYGLRRSIESAKPGETWRIRVVLLGGTSPFVDLDPCALPTGDIVLRIEPTGTVVVKLLDVEGQPWEGEVEIGLMVSSEDTRNDPWRFGDRERPVREGTIRSGTPRFEAVPLGQRFVARAVREGFRVGTHVEGAGPLTPGETTELTLRFGTDHPVVEVQVVDADRRLLANEELRLQFTTVAVGVTTSYSYRLQTDLLGHARFDLQPRSSEAEKCELVLVWQADESRTATGQLDLSRTFGPGLHYLGVLELDSPKAEGETEDVLLVNGQVLDSSGAPVEAAVLVVDRWQEERGEWRRDWFMRATTGPAGKFEITGVAPSGERLRIVVNKSGFLRSSVEATVGDDVELVLKAAGSFRVRVVADTGVPLEQLQVAWTLRPGGGVDGTPVRRGSQRALKPDGTFEVLSVHPGTYAVELKLPGSSKLLVHVPDLVIKPSQVTEDPRLLSIDLRGVLSAVRLQLLTGDERAVSGGATWLGPAGAAELVRGPRIESNYLVLARAEEALDVDLRPTGFGCVELRGLEDDQLVSFAPGQRVTLRIAGSTALPQPPWYLKADLKAAGTVGHIVAKGAEAFDKSRELVLDDVSAGSVELIWVLEHRTVDGRMAGPIDAVPPQVFTIQEGVKDQVLELDLTPDELERMFAGK